MTSDPRLPSSPVLLQPKHLFLGQLAGIWAGGKRSWFQVRNRQIRPTLAEMERQATIEGTDYFEPYGPIDVYDPDGGQLASDEV